MNRVARISRFLAVVLVAYGLPASAASVDETIWAASYRNEPIGCELEARFFSAQESDLALPLEVAVFVWFAEDVEVPSYTYPGGFQHIVLRFSREWPPSDKAYIYPTSVSINGQPTVQLKFEDDELHDSFFVLRLIGSVSTFLEEAESTDLSLRIEYEDGSKSDRKIGLFDSVFFRPGLAMFNACIEVLDDQQSTNTQ